MGGGGGSVHVDKNLILPYYYKIRRCGLERGGDTTLVHRMWI